MMKSIFISSRMNELAIDRRVTFSIMNYLSFRPLMFETEPISKLRESLNNMIAVSDKFLGIYFKTAGQRNFELYHLTPIEYELAYFIRSQCLKQNKGKTDLCKNVQGCLQFLRQCLTGHYCIRLDGGQNYICEHDLPIHTDDESQCLNALSHARPKIITFCKMFNDERALSPQLLVLLQGLTRLGIYHEDYDDEWDLVHKLTNRFAQKDKESEDTEEPVSIDSERYYVEYEGKDKKGLIKQIAKYAFTNHLNIENLNVHTSRSKKSTSAKNRKTFISAIFSDYGIDLGNNDKQTVDFKEKIINDLTNLEDSQKNKLRLFNKRSFKTIEKIYRSKAKGDAELREIVFSEVHFDDWNERIPHIFIRVYHLNVPGIIYNITRVLSGDERYGSKFNLNIERCQSREPRNWYYIANSKERRRLVEKDEIFWPVRFNYRMRDNHQITELLVSIDEDSKYDDGLADKIFLENTLSRIVGVLRVMISEEKKIIDSPEKMDEAGLPTGTIEIKNVVKFYVRK